MENGKQTKPELNILDFIPNFEEMQALKDDVLKKLTAAQEALDKFLNFKII